MSAPSPAPSSAPNAAPNAGPNAGPKIAALCGSLRTASLNRKLLALGAAAARELGAEVDVIDLRALALPVYDGDLEEASGLPAGAVELQARIKAADGLLIASPEYNGSIPGAFKNAIDWASRGPGNPFPDKRALLTGASPGAFGTVRGIPHLRHVLTILGVWVAPQQVTLPRAGDAFDEHGALRDPKSHALLVKCVTAFVQDLRRGR